MRMRGAHGRRIYEVSEWYERSTCIRVGILRDGGVENKDSHGALDAIDGRRHIGVGLFDEHGCDRKLLMVCGCWIVLVMNFTCARMSLLGRVRLLKPRGGGALGVGGAPLPMDQMM